ncbi:hypothetical protein D9756_003289 [Leucocoprinus leucothites]|uniref:F-box domain-containing protein n=1 Tax=Leucocoprinus leucothites TaxID=201217 RepID=A0A8H5G6P5_9AGAR|nr:hypothetical protein D9756_003289 [Leucoagaricus leucothites]
MSAVTLSDLPAEVIYKIFSELDPGSLLTLGELDRYINRLALQVFFGATKGGTQLEKFPPPFQYSPQLLYHGLRMAIGLEQITRFEFCILDSPDAARRQLHFLRLRFQRLRALKVCCLWVKIQRPPDSKEKYVRDEIWRVNNRSGDSLILELQELMDVVVSKECEKFLIGIPSSNPLLPSRLSSSQIRAALLKHSMVGAPWRWAKSLALSLGSSNLNPTSTNTQGLELKDCTLCGLPFLGPNGIAFNLNLLERSANSIQRLELNTEGLTRSNTKLKALLSSLWNEIHLPNLKQFVLTTRTWLIPYSYLAWFLFRHQNLASIYIVNAAYPTIESTDLSNSVDIPLIPHHIHLPALNCIRCPVHITAWLLRKPHKLPPTLRHIHLNAYGHRIHLLYLGRTIRELRGNTMTQAGSLVLDANWWTYARNVSHQKDLDIFGPGKLPKLKVGKLVLILSPRPTSCSEIDATILADAFIYLIRHVFVVDEVEINPRSTGQHVLSNSRTMVRTIKRTFPTLQSVKCDCTFSC